MPKLTPSPAEKDLFAPSTRWATVDGDADRLLYFFCPEISSSVNLLDGDHIAALFTTFIADQLVEHQRLQSCESERTGTSRLRLGVVQTAYANAASTRFLKKYLEGRFANWLISCSFINIDRLSYTIGRNGCIPRAERKSKERIGRFGSWN